MRPSQMLSVQSCRCQRLSQEIPTKQVIVRLLGVKPLLEGERLVD